MRSFFLGRSGWWVLSGFAMGILFLVMVIGFNFLKKLQNSELSIQREFLVNQSRFSTNDLEREFGHFLNKGEDFAAHLDSLNWGESQVEDLLLSEVNKFLDSYPQLIDTLWIDFGDSASFFTHASNNEIVRGSDFDSPPFHMGFFLEFGKVNGIMVSYWLNIQKFTRDVLPAVFSYPGVGQYLVSDSQLIDVTRSPSVKKFSAADWKKTLNTSYLGLTGFYQVTWKEGNNEIHGYLIHTPVSFGRPGFPTALITLVPLDSLYTADYTGLINLTVVLGVVLFGLTIGLVFSLKTNFSYSKTKETADLAIDTLFEQRNLVMNELRGFVFFHNANLEIQKISGEFDQFFGFYSEELNTALLDQPWQFFIGKIKHELTLAIHQKESFLVFEYDLIREEEQPKKIRLFEKLVYDQFGQFVRGIGICRDISDHDKAQKEIILSENRLRSLINNLPDIIFIYDNEGRVIDVHLQEKEHLLKTATANLGKKLEEFIPTSQVQEILSAFRKARLTGKIQSVNMPWQDEYEGLKYYEIRFFPLDQHQMISIAKDVTNQKIWENGLKEAMYDADLANKAKSEFLANMSHEIRTPMNSLMGIIDLLEGTSLDKIQRKYLDIIKNSGNSLLTILRDVLDYSRIDSGKIEIQNSTFNPVEQVKAQIEQLKELCNKKNILLDFTFSEKEGKFFEGDNAKINQILQNIIGNAIKFTPENGKVGVVLESEEFSGQLVYLRYKVSDTGIGISEENAKYLFKPFYQVESSNTKSYQGMGLGLAIAKKMVELLGGELTFESLLGKGAVFCFTVLVKQVSDFPLQPLDSYPTEKDEGEIARFRLLRVLLAEDNDLNLQLMTLMFKQLGFKFEFAKNGQEVIGMVKSRKFDLVLMDVQMPIMNGLETTRQIRSLPDMDDLIIIGLSANVFQEDVKKARESGMDDYLTKPIRLAVLAEKLEYYFSRVKRKGLEGDSLCPN